MKSPKVSPAPLEALGAVDPFLEEQRAREEVAGAPGVPEVGVRVREAPEDVREGALVRVVALQDRERAVERGGPLGGVADALVDARQPEQRPRDLGRLEAVRELARAQDVLEHARDRALAPDRFEDRRDALQGPRVRRVRPG